MENTQHLARHSLLALLFNGKLDFSKGSVRSQDQSPVMSLLLKEEREKKMHVRTRLLVDPSLTWTSGRSL